MKITIFPHTLGMVVDLLLAKPANVDLSFENSVERFLRVSYERTISENYISAITCILLVRRATKIARNDTTIVINSIIWRMRLSLRNYKH